MPAPPGGLVHLPFRRQQGLITDEIPLPIQLLALDVKQAQTAVGEARHAGLTDAQALGHPIPGAQPQQPVEGGQHVLLNQGGWKVFVEFRPLPAAAGGFGQLAFLD